MSARSIKTRADAASGSLAVPDPARQLYGRIGAYTVHAAGKTNTEPARRAFLARFERQVDPDGTLPPAERSRRAEAAKRAYFARLSMSARNSRRNAPEAA